MQMPPQMLAALKAQLVEPSRGWHIVSAMDESHTSTTTTPDPMGGPPSTVETVTRSASLTVQSEVMGGRVIVFMLEGGESAWDSGRAIFDGVSFDFDDAPLLTYLNNAMAALNPVAAAAIMDSYFGPVPPGGGE